MPAPDLVGTVPGDRIRPTGDLSVPADTVRRYLALPDMTCAVADVLDRLGAGAVGRGDLHAVRAGSRVCGPAVTLRYEPVGPATAPGRQTLLGDRALYRLAPAGAVAVVDTGGDHEHAVVGEISAAWAALGGLAGVLADGAVRDLDALRGDSALPVWSRARAPRNARGRLDAAELNGPVRLDGVPVRPGDLVLADDNGIAAVPRPFVDEVLDGCERDQRAEAGIHRALADSADLTDLIARLRADTTR